MAIVYCRSINVDFGISFNCDEESRVKLHSLFKGKVSLLNKNFSVYTSNNYDLINVEKNKYLVEYRMQIISNRNIFFGNIKEFSSFIGEHFNYIKYIINYIEMNGGNNFEFIRININIINNSLTIFNISELNFITLLKVLNHWVLLNLQKKLAFNRNVVTINAKVGDKHYLNELLTKRILSRKEAAMLKIKKANEKNMLKYAHKY